MHISPDDHRINNAKEALARAISTTTTKKDNLLAALDRAARLSADNPCTVINVISHGLCNPAPLTTAPTEEITTPAGTAEASPSLLGDHTVRWFRPT
ncbi:hypothetical protein J7I84_05235 [Arthrobacter sp. ISL-85]|uniref:hypothetical protein n=1 Tax=Arthrobacter sp. ISL-85 TaxID=2819115 RepID=UPI001BE5C49D|nr:hypothetical protein [Arthrobacter sp. ISL-85]MBT2565908.1 hypothetical protein [Arthrobacter sp. ISL-85]